MEQLASQIEKDIEKLPQATPDLKEVHPKISQQQQFSNEPNKILNFLLSDYTIVSLLFLVFNTNFFIDIIGKYISLIANNKDGTTSFISVLIKSVIVGFLFFLFKKTTTTLNL